MEQTYTIAKIIKETEVQGRSGKQTRTLFTTNEEGEKAMSAFSNSLLRVGLQVTGTITEKMSDDGQRTFYNFNFARRASGPYTGGVMPEFKKIYAEVYAARQEIVMVRQLLQQKGSIASAPQTSGIEYPSGPDTTPPHPFDDERTVPVEAYDTDEDFHPSDIGF